MDLDLEEAVFGVSKQIEIPTQVNCHHCNGSGSADGKVTKCATCHGHGQVRMQNGIFSIQQACPHCGGTGQAIENPCRKCHGEGRIEETRTLSVQIRSEEHTSELQSLMRISYAVFCLKKKTINKYITLRIHIT